MEEPELIPCAACGHVEALLGRFVRQRSDSVRLSVFVSLCRHHAKKNDVSLVPLKGIGISTDQPSFFNLLKVHTF